MCGLALASLLLSTPARATQVNWRCPLFATNLHSDGSPLDESFVFFLGSFAPGFVPSPANVGEWASHWTSRDQSLYNPQTRAFASRAEYTTEVPSFPATTQAYIWGCNGACADAEWVVATHPAWRWPAADGSPAAPVVTWTMADATIAVVGAVNGPGFVMKTAGVASAAPPALPPEVWRALHFSAAERADPALSGWDADPDRDGADTLREYAMGTHPRQAASRDRSQAVPDPAGPGGPALVWSLPRDRRSLAHWEVEESTALDDWVPAAAGIVVSPATASGFQARVPLGEGPRRFLRVRLSLTP